MKNIVKVSNKGKKKKAKPKSEKVKKEIPLPTEVKGEALLKERSSPQQDHNPGAGPIGR